MRTISIAGLAGLSLLVAACGGGGKDLAYGAAQAPTFDEQAAGADAQAALLSGLAFAPSTEPTAGGPGLADQLAGTLGGSAAPTASLPAAPAARVGRALGRATALPGTAATIDPACVTFAPAEAPTSATWSGCVVTLSETDPYTGDTTDMTAHIDGHLGWSAATGVTSWDIRETIAIVMISDGETMRMNATVGLAGAITVTATTIKGHTASTVAVNLSYLGQNLSEGLATTLDLDLAYQADPPCITGGTLTLEQLWTRRPAGMTAADLPNQGWKFEWTGCGLFTVAHGG